MKCCPNISRINGYGLRGSKKNRFSGISRADIEAQCAGLHLPAPPLVASSSENAAYNQCVSAKLQERGEGRLQTFMSIGDWFSQTFLGRGRSQQDYQGDPSADEPQGGGLLTWLVLILIVAALIGVSYLIFRKN